MLIILMYVNGGGFTPSCPNEGTTNLFLNQREVSGSEKLLFHHHVLQPYLS